MPGASLVSHQSAFIHQSKFLFTSRDNAAQCISENYFCAPTHMRTCAHFGI